LETSSRLEAPGNLVDNQPPSKEMPLHGSGRADLIALADLTPDPPRETTFFIIVQWLGKSIGE